MPFRIAVIAPGAMGAAVGGRLAAAGCDVVTLLEGRSAASAGRAQAAGMRGVGLADLTGADMILSIVPPGEARALAERLRPVLTPATVYVDCNAVSPETAQGIGAVIAAAGARFVDAGIVGGPPRPGYDPVFYASGPDAADFARLSDHGLVVRVLDGPVGAASAMKMSYAGIAKGLIGLGSAVMLGAIRAGSAEALRAELGASQPMLLAWFERHIPGMFPKAYRWVAEMEEISAFLDTDPAAAKIFEGLSQLYARLAVDAEGETAALAAFLNPPAPPAGPGSGAPS